MKRIIFLGLVVIFSFGCGNDFYDQTLESNVTVKGKEYKVFYTVERNEGDINWMGVRPSVVKYKIRDEATKNSEFYILIENNNRMASMGFIVYPMYFLQVEAGSFLQEIVLKNDINMGQVIFRDIFDQLERSREK